MTALVHDPKAGALLTGAEWEGDAHRWVGSASDPGAIGAGKTWLRPSALAGYQVWQPLTFYDIGSFIIPDPSNGHTYEVSNALTSGATQPDFFTDGSNTPDGDGEWVDHGLAPAGAELYVRNEFDTGWRPVGTVFLDGNGNLRSRARFDSDEDRFALETYTPTGALVGQITMEGDNVHISGPEGGRIDLDTVVGGHLRLYPAEIQFSSGSSSGTAETGIAYGDADPNALTFAHATLGWLYIQSDLSTGPFFARPWVCDDIDPVLHWTPLVAADLSALTLASTLTDLLTALGVS